MKRILFVVGLLALMQAGCGGSTGTTPTTINSAEDVAEVVAISAGSLSQTGSISAPDVSASASAPVPVGSLAKAITGFTFNEETGQWAGDTQYGATPTLTFYLKSDGSLITVDVTDDSNYQPDGALFGVTPINQDGSGIQMTVTVVVDKTFTGQYTLEATVATGLIDGDSQYIGPDAEYSYTGGAGTVTGSFGTIVISSIEFTASEGGAVVSGSYTFSVEAGGETYSGTAQFDQGGCNGATIVNADGETLGTAQINDAGQLIFTDAQTGTTTTIERLES